ncbi:ATP-binding SpoIIE family protein phosphatase [Salipiger bermudensis]|uniref:ATP-binding SpoIIE family protein phosphatase n=1 Tax=Salipiger bermudensis TaxID=344736 RepID=UPI001CD5C029|nr:ATP-binding SpoIIE family protein phosphatase [Salipiger bermudensis]MCA0961492.1 ATP-binding protein/SpoIIE family protein phosphatase [Salipiger bermudensis]
MNQWVEIDDRSAVAVVRRLARRHGAEIGLPETRLEELAIVASEAATNILRYATRGRALIEPMRGPDAGRIAMIFTDRGPGIPDIDRMFEDGESSTESAGLGLGAIVRLSDSFDIFSAPEHGTTIVCTFGGAEAGRTGDVEAVGLRVCHPHETSCGDDYQIRQTPLATDVLLCDGLGHGPAAAEAAAEVTDAAVAAGGLSSEPGKLMRQITESLVGKRGAVAALVHIAQPQMELRYAGLGNISTLVIGAGGVRRMAVRDGRIGGAATRGYEEATQLEAGDMVIMHSDGLKTLRENNFPQGILRKSPLLIAGFFLDRAFRGRDDASIVVMRINRERTQ